MTEITKNNNSRTECGSIFMPYLKERSLLRKCSFGLLRLELFKNSLDLHLLTLSADHDRYRITYLALADQ